jgi:hypothetical protein
MAVVKGKTNAIEAKAGEEFGIIFHKEVFEELVEEEFVFLWPEDFEHCSSVLILVARVASTNRISVYILIVGERGHIHEVFHIHPSSQASTSQNNCIPFAINYFLSLHSKETIGHCGELLKVNF